MVTLTAITGTTSSGTPTQQAQQVTVAQYPSANPAWSRNVQISPQYVFVKRGTAAFGILLTDLVAAAVTAVPALSWAPLITSQPSSASCVHSSTAATFSVTAGATESSITYQWQYSTNNGTTWANATGTISSCVFTNSTTAALTATPTATTLTGCWIRCAVTNASGTTYTNNGVVLTIT